MSSRLSVFSYVVGMFGTNCYLAADADSLDAIIIDPGGDPDPIRELIRSEGLNVQAIVNTHGHADHIGANKVLHDEFGCPIMVHKLDAACLTDPEANLSVFAGYSGVLSPSADRLLTEGDEICVGQLRLSVLHTPGHTPGGICLLTEGVLFSGDTLFASSIGRTDFPGGSHEQLLESIRAKLLSLPDHTLVYPGHGPSTTIGVERMENPWL